MWDSESEGPFLLQTLYHFIPPPYYRKSNYIGSPALRVIKYPGNQIPPPLWGSQCNSTPICRRFLRQILGGLGTIRWIGDEERQYWCHHRDCVPRNSCNMRRCEEWDCSRHETLLCYSQNLMEDSLLLLAILLTHHWCVSWIIGLTWL